MAIATVTAVPPAPPTGRDVIEACAALEEKRIRDPARHPTHIRHSSTAAISDNWTLSAGVFNRGIAAAIFNNRSIL